MKPEVVANNWDSTVLEPVLVEVQATLTDLLAAADEQQAAVVSGDRTRLETVTRLQERLSSRLERAEHKRLEHLGGTPLATALAELPADQSERLKGLSRSIAEAVKELEPRHVRNAQLLKRSAELTGQTVMFLQRLVSPPSASYSARGRRVPQQSLLLDSRA